MNQAKEELEMNFAQAAAYRQGVADVAAIARQSADTIEARSKRPLHDGFACEALRGLADAAEAMIRHTVTIEAKS